jgi:hypothetical protein
MESASRRASESNGHDCRDGVVVLLFGQPIGCVMKKRTETQPEKRTSQYRGVPADDIRSGKPKAYLDHIERTYGEAFRSGTSDAAETFFLLYQQISAIGNEHSTELFLSRFLPQLTKDVRRKIINEIMPNANPKPRRND